MISPPNRLARRLFAPIAPSYERWARLLSLGQDGRWRRRMVAGLNLGPGMTVLDVAAGTGSISRLLEERGCAVIALDLTPEMIRQHPGRDRVLGRAEELPFEDGTFAALTFGYLLRYVDDPVVCLVELRRVLMPGGQIGMVEFGLPRGVWSLGWRLYSDLLLPLAGKIIGGGWYEVGAFLRRSIQNFHQDHADLERMWRDAGFTEIRVQPLSLGGGVVIWARQL